MHEETDIFNSFLFCFCCFVVSICKRACVPKAESVHTFHWCCPQDMQWYTGQSRFLCPLDFWLPGAWQSVWRICWYEFVKGMSVWNSKWKWFSMTDGIKSWYCCYGSFSSHLIFISRKGKKIKGREGGRMEGKGRWRKWGVFFLAEMKQEGVFSILWPVRASSRGTWLREAHC